MYRRSSILVLGVVLAISTGCRQTCGSGSGWSSSNSNCNSASQTYRLAGNQKPLAEGCYDAVTGVPVPCPPPGTGMVISPGGFQNGPMPQQMPLPNELPFPTPNIPPTSIPSAVPTPAPGFGASLNPGAAQPTKIAPIK